MDRVERRIQAAGKRKKQRPSAPRSPSPRSLPLTPHERRGATLVKEIQETHERLGDVRKCIEINERVIDRMYTKIEKANAELDEKLQWREEMPIREAALLEKLQERLRALAKDFPEIVEELQRAG